MFHLLPTLTSKHSFKRKEVSLFQCFLLKLKTEKMVMSCCVSQVFSRTGNNWPHHLLWMSSGISRKQNSLALGLLSVNTNVKNMITYDVQKKKTENKMVSFEQLLSLQQTAYTLKFLGMIRMSLEFDLLHIHPNNSNTHKFTSQPRVLSNKFYGIFYVVIKSFNFIMLYKCTTDYYTTLSI